MVSWVDVNIEIRGKEILDSVEGPAVLISNHQVCDYLCYFWQLTAGEN